MRKKNEFEFELSLNIINSDWFALGSVGDRIDSGRDPFSGRFIAWVLLLAIKFRFWKVALDSPSLDNCSIRKRRTQVVIYGLKLIEEFQFISWPND